MLPDRNMGSAVDRWGRAFPQSSALRAYPADCFFVVLSVSQVAHKISAIEDPGGNGIKIQ